MKNIKGLILLAILILLGAVIGTTIKDTVMKRTIVTNGCGQYNQQTGNFEYIKK